MTAAAIGRGPVVAVVFALLVALAVPGAGAQASAPVDPQSLLQAIAGDARSERRASFVEIKTSALLAAPLESRGTLTFRPPDLLEKTTTSPQRERLQIEGGLLTIEGAALRGQVQRRVVRLSDVPLLAPLAESLRATLAGDLAALRRHYDVTVAAAPRPAATPSVHASPALRQALAKGQAWVLLLVPRDATLRAAVERVRMVGHGNEIGLIEFIEAGGDRSEMWVRPLR